MSVMLLCPIRRRSHSTIESPQSLATDKSRNAREEKRAAEVARQEMQTQLTTARTELLTDLRMVSELDQKLRDLRENIPTETELWWYCDIRDLEVSLSRLGEILQVQIGLPNYQTFHLPTVATGGTGYL